MAEQKKGKSKAHNQISLEKHKDNRLQKRTYVNPKHFLDDYLFNKTWLHQMLENPKKPLCLFDYGCTDGLISEIFSPYITAFRAISPSFEEAAIYNHDAKAAGYTIVQKSAVHGDLKISDEPQPSDRTTMLLGSDDVNGFDMIFVNERYADPILGNKLFDRLVVGGLFFVVQTPYAMTRLSGGGEAERDTETESDVGTMKDGSEKDSDDDDIEMERDEGSWGPPLDAQQPRIVWVEDEERVHDHIRFFERKGLGYLACSMAKKPAGGGRGIMKRLGTVFFLEDGSGRV